MNAKSDSQPTQDSPGISKGITLRVIQIAFSFLALVAILFLSAGEPGWTWAWVFLGVYLGSVLILSGFMFHGGQGTIAERGQPREMRTWDKIVSGLWAVSHYLALPLVAGLDNRFEWTQGFTIAGHLVGAGVFAIGLGLFGWAMVTNAFFSTVVRIQTDRGHTVCRTGPYRFVRHPGYAGAILQSLGIPFLLGSLWALIPAMLAAAFMIVRTALEDRTLAAELTGYRDYVHEVCYRLIPGIW